MIAIYSVEHLARAMWADAEESYRRSCEKMLGKSYRTVEWDEADSVDRADFLERADRVVRLCRVQAKALVR